MRIDIQTRGFTLTAGLRDHCERRLRFALGSTNSRLTGIAIRLTDVNGPRGGVDKRVVIKASVPGGPPLVIGQDEQDVYVAIDRAADRMSRTLSRKLQRGRRGWRKASTKLALRELAVSDPAD